MGLGALQGAKWVGAEALNRLPESAKLVGAKAWNRLRPSQIELELTEQPPEPITNETEQLLLKDIAGRCGYYSDQEDKYNFYAAFGLTNEMYGSVLDYSWATYRLTRFVYERIISCLVNFKTELTRYHKHEAYNNRINVINVIDRAIAIAEYRMKYAPTHQMERTYAEISAEQQFRDIIRGDTSKKTTDFLRKQRLFAAAVQNHQQGILRSPSFQYNLDQTLSRSDESKKNVGGRSKRSKQSKRSRKHSRKTRRH
jgi:hypothetical protein